MKRQKNYDKKVKLTRILLSDYLVIKRLSQAAGISMSQALHKLIEHQAQLPLLSRLAPAAAIAAHLTLAKNVTPRSAIATNGSKVAAFRIKPKGARYD